MFFSPSQIPPERKREPHQLFERVVDRPDRGLQELKEYVRLRVREGQIQEVESILRYFTFRNSHQLSMGMRILLINCFEVLICELKQSHPELKKAVPEVISSVLVYFSDPFERVQEQAVSTVYNILNYFNHECLPVFTKVFGHLLQVVPTDSSSLKIALGFLNQALKNILNDAIFDHEYFDVNQFMSILIENFITESPLVKEFLIDWLISIDEIPEFQISFYLPLVFKQLFKLMEEGQGPLRDKSEECLKNFLASFRELLVGRVRIQKKIREDSFSMLMGVLLEVNKESLLPEAKYHALEWLQMFTQLFYNELIKKDHVQVRQSFRSEYLLREMKEQKLQRTSKILSLIREEALEGEANELGKGYKRSHEQNRERNSQEVVYEQFGEKDEQLPAFLRAKTEQAKVGEFLVQVFLSYYHNIIILVMHSFSNDSEKIRKITISINRLLLKCFPLVHEKAKKPLGSLVGNLGLRSNDPDTIMTSQSQNYLEKLELPLVVKLGKYLKQSRSLPKIEAIIKWIKLLYEKSSNPQLNLEVSSLTQKIVEKICQKSQLSVHHYASLNKELFRELSDSIFLGKHLQLFLQTLLAYFYQYDIVESQRILVEVVRPSGSPTLLSSEESELRYLSILKRLALFQAEKGQFKLKMIENLISILITEDSLAGLREKLRKPLYGLSRKNPNTVDRKIQTQLQMKAQLFQYFCLNEGFALVFCFLTGMYRLAFSILEYLASQHLLERRNIRAFIKASNLLQCYTLSHFRKDILNNQEALKAYLGFLMVIPPSKLNHQFMTRIPPDLQPYPYPLNQSISGKVSEPDQDDFQNSLFKKYVQESEKYHKQKAQLQKAEKEKKMKEEQRDRLLTVSREKQISICRDPKGQKSILKSTSLQDRELRQSESEKRLPRAMMLEKGPSKKVSLKLLNGRAW